MRKFDYRAARVTCMAASKEKRQK